MTITRGEIKDRIWRFLNKTKDYPGFYTSDKLDDAIQEALEFISVEMFLAGEGWQTSQTYYDTTTVAARSTVAIPTTIALIREVRYKYGDIYVPLTYDDQDDSPSFVGSGDKQFASRWRMLGTNIVFDPPMSEGGVDYLQIEATSYPASLEDDDDVVNPQFDNAMINYLKYKCASILAGSIEKEIRTWGQEENEWYDKMVQVVTRRNLKSTRIKEFL